MKPETSTNALWTASAPKDGVKVYQLASWTHLFDLVESNILNTLEPCDYIWRGQRESSWSLSTTLDRLFEGLEISGSSSRLEELASAHLENFKMAARGRRGLNPAKLNTTEWWALGQHFGLATPYLDWTKSPFAATYFAFEEAKPSASEFRTVFALDRRAVFLRSHQINQSEESIENGRVALIEFIEPLYDENQRLVSQGGLFTRSPIATPVERWVQQAFEGINKPVLIAIKIHDSDRAGCLRALDRMNINHVSLFPDLSGASRATNLKPELYSQILENPYATVRPAIEG